MNFWIAGAGRGLHGLMVLRFSICEDMATELIPLDCPHNNCFNQYSRIKADEVSNHSIFKDLAGRRRTGQKDCTDYPIDGPQHRKVWI